MHIPTYRDPLSSMATSSAVRGARVLLAYVSYPVTTAVYLERALRRTQQVVTCGPRMDESLLRQWNLENMRVPVRDQDIPLGYEPNMADLLGKLRPELYPDLYLWVESVPGHYPRNLAGVRCPKACYLIDSHLNLETHLSWAKQFDFVFIAQREYLEDFRAAGNRSVFWLPLAADPDIHRTGPGPRTFDIGFVGSLNNPRRVNLLRRLEERFPVRYERCFWTEMADFFSRSKLVFNNAVRNDLNMRVFEVLSTGTFLLTDNPANSGQEELFLDGEDLGVYTDETILEKALFYLGQDTLRERIAKRGQMLVHAAHTYAHRVDELLNVVLGGQQRTPSATEWRERSLATGVRSESAARAPAVTTHEPSRSFVIPVLDMSPASPYNITGLLNDLTNVQGTVIVIFNSRTMADQLKDHPRIDYWAAMSENVGVARAWNIGLHMVQTPVTFVLNADLHVEAPLFDTLERSFRELPQAAIVGPQGGFFHFPSARDLMYFDKGSLKEPMEVDDVSGFLFGLRMDVFQRHGIQFDDQYSPCYFEEWDIALQCRRYGWKSYVVPVTGYAHEWSGSIRGMRVIRYLKQEETAQRILERNRVKFWEKWNAVVSETGDATLLESRWVEYMLRMTDSPGTGLSPADRERIVRDVVHYFPGSARASAALQKLQWSSQTTPFRKEKVGNV